MDKIIDFFKTNPIIFYVSVGVLVAIVVVVVIALIVKGNKKQQNVNNAKAQTAPTVENLQDDTSVKTETDATENTQKDVQTSTENTEKDVPTSTENKETDDKEPKKEQKAQTTEKVATSVKAPATKEEKTATAKPATKEKAKKPVAKPKTSGKWTIYSYLDENKTRFYTAILTASNGEPLLNIESYTTLDGVIGGLETVKHNVANGNFVYKEDKNKNWNFKLYTQNKMLLCVGEGYTSKFNCENAIESVKKYSASAAIIDDTANEKLDELEVRVSTAPTETKDSPDNSAMGKWVIATFEENGKTWYTASLKASNGIVILNTEAYTSLNGIHTGIETIKKNISTNNFMVKEDKNGNWNFKLYNARKMLLCLGEGYTSKFNCENAIESVKNFALNSTIVDN